MFFAGRFTPTIKEFAVLKMTVSTTWTRAQWKCKTKKIKLRPKTVHENTPNYEHRNINKTECVYNHFKTLKKSVQNGDTELFITNGKVHT